MGAHSKGEHWNGGVVSAPVGCVGGAPVGCVGGAPVGCVGGASVGCVERGREGGARAGCGDTLTSLKKMVTCRRCRLKEDSGFGLRTAGWA